MKRWVLAAAAVSAALLASGCIGIHRSAPRPGLTYVGSHPVTLPARLLGNVLIVETKGDENGPYHFVIDTGSSVTLVSPELAKRLKLSELMPTDVPKVRVRSSEGGTALLDAVTLEKIQLGSARFEYVPALVYDCADVSDQFGVRIDGILGFPLFRYAVLTLDYPHQRVVLRSEIPKEGLPGEAILFDNAEKTPLIAIRLGDRELEALIDSGSSASIDINPAGLAPKFSYGPVDGPTVSTLAGDRPSKVGRLSDVVRVGSFDIPQPIAEITDELSSLGGGILAHFTVTFDQEHNEAFFQHEPADSLSTPPLRGTGLSFRKTPAYWKVAGVAAGSPAEGAGVHTGDLISRINGEPVANWDLPRYEALVASVERIDFTFINGARATPRTIAVAALVP